MKKILFLSLVFVFMISAANAQILKSYGAKIGITKSYEKWDYTLDALDFKSDPWTGMNISIFTEFPAWSFISILTEFTYNQKGMELKLPVATHLDPIGTGEHSTYYGANVVLSNDAYYLELLAALKFTYENPKISPYITAGPRIGIMISNEAAPGFEEVYDDYRSFVYGFKFGAGAEIRNVIPRDFLIEFQYNVDAVNVYESDILEINSNSYEIKLGLLL